MELCKEEIFLSIISSVNLFLHFRYGVKIRLPHALVMTFLFGKGT